MMARTEQPTAPTPVQLSQVRHGVEGRLTRASPATGSFSESLVSKLPVGSRFATTVPPSSGGTLADDGASGVTNDEAKSASSTMRGAREGLGPSAPEERLMASLHVKFSASTRFSASDAGNERGIVAAEAGGHAARVLRAGTMQPRAPIPLPRPVSTARRIDSRSSSFSHVQLQEQLSRGRRRSGSLLLSQESEGPLNGLMRALSGRNRRSRSADLGMMQRSSGNAGSSVRSPTRVSRDGADAAGRRGGRAPLQRRRRRSASASSAEPSDGGISRRGSRLSGMGTTLLWGLFGAGNAGSESLRRSQSAPSSRGERTRSARHSRSHSFGSIFGESLLEAGDGDGHASGGSHLGRNQRRSRSRGLEADGMNEGVSTWFPSQRRRISRSRSRSLSRGGSSGELLHDATEQRQGAGAARRGSRPLLSIFSMGRAPRQHSSLREGGGSPDMPRSLSRPTSPSVEQMQESNSGRVDFQTSVSLGHRSFRSPGAAYLVQRDNGNQASGIDGIIALEHPTQVLGPDGSLEPHRPAQLQVPLVTSSVPSAALPGTISLVHRASFAAASHGGSVVPRASRAGSLPSPTLVPSPTIRSPGDRPTPPHHPPSHLQQSKSLPPQRAHSPEQRTSQTPPHVPTIRRQATGAVGLIRFASRPRSPERGARSRVALRRLERARFDGDDQWNRQQRSGSDLGFARSRSEGRKFFAGQRRQRKITEMSGPDAWSDGGLQNPQPSGIGAGGEGRRNRFMTWLMGGRRRLSGLDNPVADQPGVTQFPSDAAVASVTPVSASTTGMQPAGGTASGPVAAQPPVMEQPPPAATATSTLATSPSSKSTTLQVRWAKAEAIVAAPAGENSPILRDRVPSLSRPQQNKATADLRDSPLMQIPPSPPRPVRTVDRLRPAPLQIPSDPRAPALPPDISQSYARGGDGALATAAVSTSLTGAKGPTAPPAAAAGPVGIDAHLGPRGSGATPEKARKSAWADLGRVLGIVMRFRSPFKATPEKVKQPSTAAAAPSRLAASPSQPPSQPHASTGDLSRQGIVISASELPRPAFPVDGRPRAATDDNTQGHLSPGLELRPSSQDATQKKKGKMSRPPSRATGRGTTQGHTERSGRDALMQSVFADQAQVVFSDDDGTSAVRANGQVTNRSKRKGHYSRSKSDLDLRVRPRKGGSLTTASGGNGASGAIGRPVSAAAALGASGRALTQQLISPAGLPVGRSVSPLGRRIVEASGGGGSGSRGRGGMPVVMISALAEGIPGQVLVSPLRSPRTFAAASVGSTANPTVDPVAFVDFGGHSAVLSQDRVPTLVSALRPGADQRSPSPPGHLPRPLRVPTTPLSFGGIYSPALEADGLPQLGCLGVPTGHGAVLPGAAFARMMAGAAVGDPRMLMQPQQLRPQPFFSANAVLDPQQQQHLHLQQHRRQEYMRSTAEAEGLMVPTDMSQQTTQAGQKAAAQISLAELAATAAAVAVSGFNAGVWYGDNSQEAAAVERSRRGRAGGVMSTEVDTQGIRLMTSGRQPPLPPAPGGYRRHRPLWLGRTPAEQGPPQLQQPEQPQLLWSELLNTEAAAAYPNRPSIAHGVRRLGQARELRCQQEQQEPAPLVGAYRDEDEDNSSSLASSSTTNSLRKIQPALALEPQHRQLLDVYGPYGSSGPAGVSGVTVRTLKREVTAGPQVKLLKPRQLLRNLQPPGPTPAFTRKQPAPESVAQAQEAVTGTGDVAEAPGPSEDRLTQQPTAAEPYLEEPGPHSLPAQAMPRRASLPTDALGSPTKDPATMGFPTPRNAWSSPQRPLQPQQESDAMGWVPPPAALLRPLEGKIAVPAVRRLAVAPLSGPDLSPSRLLRMPQVPVDHQPTRRHVHQGFAWREEEPRFQNIKLMRVLEPQPKPPSGQPPGESPPPGLPMRKLRMLNRPEGQLPGVIPAGTAGRTEHLLGMLRRVDEGTRPPTGLLGQRMSLFDSMGQSGSNGAALAAQRGPLSVTSNTVSHHLAQEEGNPQSRRGSESPARHAQQPAAQYPLMPALLEPHGSVDVAIQSALPAPRIDIHVHSNRTNTTTTTTTTTGTPRTATASPTTAAAAPMQYPPPPSAAYGYQAARSPPQQYPPQQYPPEQQPPQQPQPVVMAAPTGLGSLAGLSALSQLTALASLSQLGAAVGGRTSADDPSLWPDLLETTPESLHQVSENTIARWRQQRAALAQPNLAVLRDMDPALRLEPAQMLGPGPLGEAQYALHQTSSPGVPASAILPGGPYAGGPADVPRDGSPGKWMVSRSLSGRVMSISPTAKEEETERRSAEREQRLRERERHQRRRAREGEVQGGEGMGGGGPKEKEKKKKKKSGRWKKQQWSGRHRGGKRGSSDGSEDSDSSDSSDSSGNSSSSTSSGSSRAAHHKEESSHSKYPSRLSAGKKPQQSQQKRRAISSQPNANVAVSAPTAMESSRNVSTSVAFTFGAASAQRPDKDGNAVIALPRPATPAEPGDSFGMDLAERLLQRMVEPERRPLSFGSAGRIDADGGSEKEDNEQSKSWSSPTVHSQLSPLALGPRSTGPQDASSPHAKMVDVLRGPETERKANEILDQYSSLRAKFLEAANNLRDESSASQASEQRGAATAAATQVTAHGGIGGSGDGTVGPSPGLQSTGTLAPEPTLKLMEATSAPGKSGAGDGAISVQVGAVPSSPASSTAPRQQQHPTSTNQQQSINIYCTQLVLNPGRGPITIPGLPAYYPAPGPAAWAGVPVTVPSPPLAYPGQHYRDTDGGGGPSSTSAADSGQGRAMYMEPGAQHPLQGYPPAIKVSPVATATWLPTSRGAVASEGGRGHSGKAAAATTAVAAPNDLSVSRLGGGTSGEEAFPVGSSYNPGRSPSGDDGLSQEASETSGRHVAPGKPLIRRVITSKELALDTSAGIMVLSKEDRGGPHNDCATASVSSADTAAEEAGIRDENMESERSGGARTQQASNETPGAGMVARGGTEDGKGRAEFRSGSGFGFDPRRTEPLTGSGKTVPEPLPHKEHQGQHNDQPDGREFAADSEPQHKVLPLQPPPPQRQESLAAELTQLIMEAFQQSGGVILPAGTEDIGTASGAVGVPPRVVRAAAGGGARPVYLTDAYAPTLDSAGESACTAAAAPLPPAQSGNPEHAAFLPPTLPNAAVAPGTGPTFLQVRDIELEAPPHGRAVPKRKALAADILDGLGGWEEQVMAALQGRPPGRQHLGADDGAGHSEPIHQQPGASSGQRLTAAEALVLEPDLAQQRKLNALAHLRNRQKAALAERQARYQAGLRHFTDPSQPLRPLFLPPPQHHVLLSDGEKVLGGRRSLFHDNEAHGSRLTTQPTYLTGPGMERQPYLRSPLQQRMNGVVKRRRRWTSRGEERMLSPQAAAMLQHQRNFTSQVRSAMRPITSTKPAHHDGSVPVARTGRTTRGAVTFADEVEPYLARASPKVDAVRSVAAMVAQRFEGGGWDTRGLEGVYRSVPGGGVGRYMSADVEMDDERDDDSADDDYWNEDADPLGPETICGGCNFAGCPVHGNRSARGAETPTVHTDARARPRDKRQSDRKSTTPGGTGAFRNQATDPAEDEEERQRTQRELHRAALLDKWTAEMQALGAATSRVEATQKVAVASAQQALAARHERQAAELADMFRLLGEVDALASSMEKQTKDTKKMMQALEEEAELRRVVRLNSLLLEAKRLGGLVDESLQQTTNDGEGEGDGAGEGASGRVGIRKVSRLARHAS